MQKLRIVNLLDECSAKRIQTESWDQNLQTKTSTGQDQD